MFRRVDNYVSFEGRFAEMPLHGFLPLRGQASVWTLSHWVEMIHRLSIYSSCSLLYVCAFKCVNVHVCTHASGDQKTTLGIILQAIQPLPRKDVFSHWPEVCLG